MKPEAQLSKDVQAFLRDVVGCAVWSLEQGYRKERGGTRQTPGIGDLYVMHPRIPGGAMWVELKTPRNRLTPAQQVFRDECARCDVPWALWRSVEEAWDYMVGIGVIEEAA